MNPPGMWHEVRYCPPCEVSAREEVCWSCGSILTVVRPHRFPTAQGSYGTTLAELMGVTVEATFAQEGPLPVETTTS